MQALILFFNNNVLFLDPTKTKALIILAKKKIQCYNKSIERKIGNEQDNTTNKQKGTWNISWTT